MRTCGFILLSSSHLELNLLNSLNDPHLDGIPRTKVLNLCNFSCRLFLHTGLLPSSNQHHPLNSRPSGSNRSNEGFDALSLEPLLGPRWPQDAPPSTAITEWNERRKWNDQSTNSCEGREGRHLKSTFRGLAMAEPGMRRRRGDASN